MRIEGSIRLSEFELHLRGTTRDRVLGIAGGMPPLVDHHQPREADARVETCVNDQGE